MNVSHALMLKAFRTDPEDHTPGAEVARRWMQSGFPQVVLGHKLAASLACTSIPDEAMPAEPWPAFLLLVPSGLIYADGLDGPSDVIAQLVVAMGRARGPATGQSFYTEEPTLDGGFEPLIVCLSDGSGMSAQQTPRNMRAIEALRRLLIGVLIELDCTSVQSRIGVEGAKARLSARTSGTLPKAWTFTLTRSVTLDVRAEVARHCLNGEGKSPSVQTLVRGHHKRQAHGPGRLERKWIHVEPYWRGPEDAPIGVRSHIIPDRA